MKRPYVQLRVILPLQRTARVHVFVAHHLVEGADRGAGHTPLHQLRECLLLGVAAGPVADQHVNFVHGGNPFRQAGKARFGDKVRPAHRLAQAMPLAVADTDDRDPAIAAGVDVVRALGHAAVAVASAGRRRGRVVLRAPDHAEGGGQRRIDRVLPRHAYPARNASAFTVPKRRGYRAIEVDAGEEIAQRRARLARRAVGKDRD